jgi:hypothetical protein
VDLDHCPEHPAAYLAWLFGAAALRPLIEAEVTEAIGAAPRERSAERSAQRTPKF